MSLAKALEGAEVFTDGDWVESKDQDPNGDVRLIQLADIGVGEYLDRSARYLTSKKAAELDCTYLKPGDLLLARMPDPIGRACLFPGDAKPCVTVVDVCVIRANQASVDHRWLMHWFNSPLAGSAIRRLTTGTTRKRISRGNIEKLPIVLPTIEEQRRISRELDASEALRTKRREAFDKLEALRSALVSDALAQYTEREPLGDHLDFVTSGSRGWAKYYSESGSRFIRSQDVLMGSISDTDPAFVSPPGNAESKRTAIKTGDLLVTITGIVGRVTAASSELENSYVSQHVSIARPSATLRPRFAEAFMNSREGQAQLERAQYGQTKPGLNLKQIRGFLLPVPGLKQQDELLEKLDQVRSQSERMRRSRMRLDTLFASLQQRAFRDEL